MNELEYARRMADEANREDYEEQRQWRESKRGLFTEQEFREFSEHYDKRWREEVFAQEGQ